MLGGQIGYDQDLRRESVSYSNAGLPAQQLVGGSRVVLGLVLGVAIDIGNVQ